MIKLLFALFLLHTPAYSQEPVKSSATFCSSRKIAEKITKTYCRERAAGDSSARISVTLFRNNRGFIGGYVLNTEIVTEPIQYFDCEGNVLLIYEPYGPDDKKAPTPKIIEALRKHFPVREVLDCGNSEP